MRKPVLTALAVYLFVGIAPSGAQSCKDLIGSIQLSGTELRNTRLALQAARDGVAAKPDLLPIPKVSSVGELTAYLMQAAETGGANREIFKNMSAMLFNRLGADGVQRLVHDLTFIPRYRVAHEIWMAAVGVYRGEYDSADSLLRVFPKKEIDEAAFAERVKLGQNLRQRTRFLESLELAISDAREFDHVRGKYVGTKASFNSIVEGLEALRDPSVVGQFMQTFGRADRLTRQYIVDRIKALDTADDGRTFVFKLKGQPQDGQRDETAKTLADFLKMPLDQIQEKAYFDNRSNGDQQRPVYPPYDVTRSIAVRFLAREKFNATEPNVQYAYAYLLENARVDRELDAVLMQLMKSYDRDGLGSFMIPVYARLELEIMGRNLRGLSSIPVVLRYQSTILANKTPYYGYLSDLVKFNSDIGLDKAPELRDIAMQYFARFPEALDELHLDPAVKAKFKSDLRLP